MDPEAEDVMEALSSLSQLSYVNLVTHSDFVSYFNQASPVDELSLLKIGSRPQGDLGRQFIGFEGNTMGFCMEPKQALDQQLVRFGEAVKNFRNKRIVKQESLRKTLRRVPLFHYALMKLKSLYCWQIWK